jgi:glycosyltransferase involved in cell wall biosynthesis
VGLAQALSSVLDNRALALRFGAAARQRFEDCFTADNMSRLTLDLYQALLRR